MRVKEQRYRLVAACVSASVAVVLFAVMGGIGMAQSAIALAQYQYGHGGQYQYGKKITICHKGKNTITVGKAAVPAHLRHGDTVGPCANGNAKKAEKSQAHESQKPGNGKGRGK